MSRSIEIPLKSFPKGWFVAWNVSSQCYYNGNVQIKSDGNVLQTIEKVDHSASYQFIGNGSALIPSEDMSIVITFNEGTEPILEHHQASMFLNDRGEAVGIMVGICVEDSNDQDFNDFFISLTGWAKEG